MGAVYPCPRPRQDSASSYDGGSTSESVCLLFAIIEADLKSFHTRLICAFVGCVHFADHTPSVGST